MRVLHRCAGYDTTWCYSNLAPWHSRKWGCKHECRTLSTFSVCAIFVPCGSRNFHPRFGFRGGLLDLLRGGAEPKRGGPGGAGAERTGTLGGARASLDLRKAKEENHHFAPLFDAYPGSAFVVACFWWGAGKVCLLSSFLRCVHECWREASSECLVFSGHNS